MNQSKKITALVTGASAGLGREYCHQLAAQCDVIIAVARRKDALRTLASELVGQVELHKIAADLTTIEGVTIALEALRQLGPVDYLINNAGFGTIGDFDHSPLAGALDMVALHIDATITLCRAAIPFMAERGGGTIVNVSSLGSLYPSKGIAVYGATKAFLNYFSLALQEEVREQGIRVQALCPGYTRTEFHKAMTAEGFDVQRIPERSWMEPEAVVAASLDALGAEDVLVIPGANNRDLGVSGLQQQLASLQQ